MYTRELKTNNKNKQENNEKHNMAIEIIIDYKKQNKVGDGCTEDI